MAAARAGASGQKQRRLLLNRQFCLACAVSVGCSAPAGGAAGAEDAAPRREDDDDAGLGALAREAGVADVKPEAARAVRIPRTACLCSAICRTFAV
jgi:hypothetical protein